MKTNLNTITKLKPKKYGIKEPLESTLDTLKEESLNSENASYQNPRLTIENSSEYLPPELRLVFQATLDANVQKMKSGTKELKGRTDIKQWALAIEIMWRALLLVEKDDGKVSRIMKISSLLDELESLKPGDYHLEPFIKEVQKFIVKRKKIGK
jgi:hypothetical protein